MKLACKRAIIALLTGAVMGLPTGPATAAEELCAAEFETVTLKTFHVVLETPKKVYEIGDVVPVLAEVTRPADEDPVGQDQPMDPPASHPAEGVNIGVGLQIGRSYLFGIGKTDAAGKATIRVPIRSYVSAGSVAARAYAWNLLVTSPCLLVQEAGSTEKKNFCRVKE